MSLILDALRKADSEREREGVPGLHTQPVPPLSLEEFAAPARPKRWLWIGVGLAVLLVLALVWYFAGRDASRPPVERALPAPDPIAAQRAPAGAAPNAVLPEPARDLAAPAPWPTQERKAAAKPPASDESASASTPGTVPAIYTRDQLPDNIRGALPPLAVGGSIYSVTPANRSLILDGRLYRENEQLSSDLLLEEIRLKTAVLRFKGYRFEIQY